MSYDHWLQTEPDTEEWAECDCCGKRKPLKQMQTVWAPGGLETWACDECLSQDEEDDEEPDFYTLDELDRELIDR